MSTSQFKIFTSNDLNAPVLNGLSGSLVDVFNYCLVSGSGWLQPSASINDCAIYQQPSGSKCILYVNDNKPNVSAAGQEAWLTGWETLSNMTAPCGTGSAQFPLIGQLLVSGHYVSRKSSVASNAPRAWIMFSDDRTFYFFNKTLDIDDGMYTSIFFGDIFSLVGKEDTIKCMLSSRTYENLSSNNGLYDQNDLITYPVTYNLATYNAGVNMVMSRNMGGIYTCPLVSRLGAFDMAISTNTSYPYAPMNGVVNLMNNIIIRPLIVWEPGNGIRGRMRGMYHIPCSVGLLPDGAIYTATGENLGKTFQIISRGMNNGFWVIEISNTLETN
jgi:hypothetical protein